MMGRWSEFIKEYSSTSTIQGYEGCARKYFKYTYGTTDLESSTDRYFQEKRNHEADVRSFFVSIKDVMAPKSVQTTLAVVKALLVRNQVELAQSFWKSLGKKMKYHSITVDKVPSKEEMRQILTHMGAKGKALYLMLISSGMRINEALSLALEDVDLTKTPTVITIRPENAKVGQGRITFISAEATECLREWLKIRDGYLKSAVAQSKPNSKSLDDNCIFPFTSQSARNILLNALLKSKLSGSDSRTKRSKIHPHVFRKYFRGAMGSVIQLDVTETLMGHQGYLTEVYRRYPSPEKTLVEFYLKGEESVTIFGDTVSAEVKTAMVEQSKKIAEQESTMVQQNKTIQQAMDSIQSLTAIMARVEFRLTEYENKFGLLKDFVPELQEVAVRRRNEKMEEEKENRMIEQRRQHVKELEVIVNELSHRGKK